MITANILRQIAPNAKGTLIEALAPSMSAILPQFDVSTPLRIAHFLAQAAQETDGFKTLEEYGGPTYFARYDGRTDLGNDQPGDGARYHGRGIFQLTGKANYREMGKRLGADLIANPTLAASPELSVRIACEYWTTRGINAKADADDVEGVTRKINGGLNGLADRKTYLTRAKVALAPTPDVPAFPAPPQKPVTGTDSGGPNDTGNFAPTYTGSTAASGARGTGGATLPIIPPVPWYVALIRAILSLFGRKS